MARVIPGPAGVQDLFAADVCSTASAVWMADSLRGTNERSDRLSGPVPSRHSPGAEADHRDGDVVSIELSIQAPSRPFPTPAGPIQPTGAKIDSRPPTSGTCATARSRSRLPIAFTTLYAQLAYADFASAVAAPAPAR